MTDLSVELESICVFGGGNGWGKRIAETLSAGGFDVAILEQGATDAEIRNAISDSTLIFIAIPDTGIDDLLRSYGEAMYGRMLIDCATSKTGFSDRLCELAENGVSICSSHPMAVSSAALRGQNVLLMPVGSQSLKAESAAAHIYGLLGMHCSRFDFTRHDELMALVQLLPHLVQRAFSEALGQGLAAQRIGVADLTGLASANYLLAELGLGRVTAQRSDVSAGIIASGLATSFGRGLLDALSNSLATIGQSNGSRELLTQQFEATVQTLDPDGSWRRQMAERTEAALNRLGNLRSRSLVISAPNRIGMLRDILTVLARHGIDMTALDSQLMTGDDGNESVRFEIGISNAHVAYDSIRGDLGAIGVRLHDSDSTP